MKKTILISFFLGALALGLFLKSNPQFAYRLKSYLPVEAYHASKLEIILTGNSANYVKDYKLSMKGRVTLYPKANYVQALLVNRGDTSKIKIKPKGDWASHLERENWSFRIKQQKDRLFFHDNKKLSFHHPAERNFIFEYVFHQFLKEEGILALDYDFALVTFFEKEYLYAFEDGVGASYLKKHNIEGPIYKFEETDLFNQIENKVKVEKVQDLTLYQNANLLTQGNLSKLHPNHFLKQRVNGFPLDSFNLEQVAKYVAICDLFGAKHALRWHNLKMVKRNGLLEFIGSDANPVFDTNLSVNQNLPMIKDFFQSEKFSKMYGEYLLKYMNENHMFTFLNERNNEIQSRIKLIRNCYPNSDNNLAFLFATIQAYKNKLD